MASWYLVPCLKELFAEFDRIAPNRDHASDGSIGDAAHQAEKSDHNPDSKGAVHAIDVDSDLKASFSMEDVIQYFVAECRKNNPNGTDRGRLKYFIYNRRIWSASTGWKQENYTGSSAHTEHAHFSCEYASEYENDTSSWGLVEKFGDDVSEQDVTNALNKFFKVTDQGPDKGNMPESKIGHDASCQGVPDTINGGTTRLYQLVGNVGKQLMLARADISALLGKDFTDEAAIVQGVLAGLAGADGAAETIADAVVNALPPDLAQQVVDEMAKRLAPA
jgi:hypothetical protein